MSRRTAFAALLLVAGGCQSSALTPAVPGVDASNTAAVESACDPLAGPPIALGTVVGVGEDSSGILYVDAANGIFVSAGSDTLVRQHIEGTGQSATEYNFSFGPGNTNGLMPQNLIVETSGGVAVSMALGPGRAGQIPADGGGSVPLTLLPAATVAKMLVVNTPNVISYVANAANGDILAAIVPQNAPTGANDAGIYDGGLSIFYGPQNAIAQRPITAFEETLSGNGNVTFTVGNVAYVLSFGSVPTPDGGDFGTFTLGGLVPANGTTIGVMLQTPIPTAFPSGYSFTCLQ